jgi:hypothetical protein
MKTLLSIYFALSIAQAQNEIVHGDLRVRGGHIMLDTAIIKKNVGLDVQSRSLTDTAQIGVLSEPYFSAAATSGGAGIRIAPHTMNGAGHLPYVHMLDIYSPLFGTASGGRYVYGLYINSINGSDSGNYAIYTNRGPNRLGDTTYFAKLVQFNSGINYHGRLVSASGAVTDSDYIVLVDISSGRVVDTLPTLATSIGREYVFIQYSTAGAGNFTIKPRAGEKIETYDSICMRSNIGLSKVILVNTSTKWSILYQHEEGTFAATLTGVNAAVSDTGFYTRDNLNCHIRIKPLVGTSNLGTMTITGLDSRMLVTGLDTTYTAAETVLAYNSGAKAAALGIVTLGSGIVTLQNVSSGFAAWTTSGIKGVAYGYEVYYRLPKQPSY